MPEENAVETSETSFQPYVAPEEKRPEFTFRAISFGIFFGILFGAVTVYVGLRAGLTVSASIPIAVLSISLLRALGKASILENNIVQTTGSAGESIAGGVIFTLPALIFLGFPLEYSRIFLLALIGGWLGVFFMIPLRRQLIVKEHGNLLYPEGTACADVLIAGDKGGSFASRVFWGLGLGGLYTLFQNENLFAAWPSLPDYQPKWYPGSAIRAATTSEYLGVGYIIGPRIAGVLFSGGVFAWLVVMPAIRFFGGHLAAPLYPATKLISDMSVGEIYSAYIRPMGAGAVATAGLITLLKTIPTIVAALRAGLGDLKKGAAIALSQKRTDRDLDLKVALGGTIILLVLMWGMLTFNPIEHAPTTWYANVVSAFFVVLFGFLFVTVSSRITGLIGTSSNPISGMAIATLMATSAVFLLLHWTAGAFGALALTIGGVVCIASANAGNTSQDLKTGYLVGATPRNQQIGLMIGVLVSVFAIGLTLMGMNKALESFRQVPPIPVNIDQLPTGAQIEKRNFDYGTIKILGDKNTVAEKSSTDFYLLNVLGSSTIPDGKYLYNPQTKQIEVQWVQGIGSEKAPAPQARLMSTVISGILNQRLPWGLVLIGAFIVVGVELLGIRSLSFAVGFYISIGTTLAMFCGGIVRWLVDREIAKRGEKKDDSDASPGALYASGLIAAGGVMGLIGIGIKLLENTGKLKEGALAWGTRINFLNTHTGIANLISIATFALLAFSLYHFAKKPVEK